ncbi:MAG: PadR family transcriptional regulator [Solirubrobacterales bacterium]
MADPATRRSPLALVVLSMLAERPMHPYGMVQLLTQREKTSIVNISQRNSLYQVINRLVASGLVAVESTERSESRPDRTVYRITDSGTTTVRLWLRQMIAGDKAEFPEFVAALSTIALIAPSEVQAGLTERMSRLESQRDTMAAALATATSMQLPYLFSLDEDYRLTMLTAEIAWVRSVLDKLAAGELTWSQEWIEEIAARFAEYSQCRERSLLRGGRAKWPA